MATASMSLGSYVVLVGAVNRESDRRRYLPVYQSQDTMWSFPKLLLLARKQCLFVCFTVPSIFIILFLQMTSMGLSAQHCRFTARRPDFHSGPWGFLFSQCLCRFPLRVLRFPPVMQSATDWWPVRVFSVFAQCVG